MDDEDEAMNSALVSAVLEVKRDEAIAAVRAFVLAVAAETRVDLPVSVPLRRGTLFAIVEGLPVYQEDFTAGVGVCEVLRLRLWAACPSPVPAFVRKFRRSRARVI